MDKLATILLKKPQDVIDVIKLLSYSSETVPLSGREIGLFNTDAGYYPFIIDLFEHSVYLTGKAIKAFLSNKTK